MFDIWIDLLKREQELFGKPGQPGDIDPKDVIKAGHGGIRKLLIDLIVGIDGDFHLRPCLFGVKLCHSLHNDGFRAVQCQNIQAVCLVILNIDVFPVALPIIVENMVLRSGFAFEMNDVRSYLSAEKAIIQLIFFKVLFGKGDDRGQSVDCLLYTSMVSNGPGRDDIIYRK